MPGSGPVHIGILGAAGITPTALVAPVHATGAARLVAIAARDRARAEQFARDHSVERVHDGYAEVLADPNVEAVYIPLPNNLHAKWTMAALEAGKHVLVEKPFASNLAEAERVAEVAAAHPGLVVMEAFHNRYHALARDLQQLLGDGIIGRVAEASAIFEITLPDRGNIRYSHALAGGATMDLGCYCVHMLRTLLGEPEVVAATARTTTDPELDDALTAELSFPDEVAASIRCSLDEPRARQSLRLLGSRGAIEVDGFVHPQYGNRVTVTIDDQSTSHEVSRTPTTYEAQLTAFVAAVRDGKPVLTGPADSLRTMRVLDDLYLAAGLQPRPASPA